MPVQKTATETEPLGRIILAPWRDTENPKYQQKHKAKLAVNVVTLKSSSIIWRNELR